MVVACASPACAQEPTPQDIVNGWATLSGGLSAKLVYWDETICVMDLTTGASTSINDYPCTERHGNFDDDYVPHTKWSPNGQRPPDLWLNVARALTCFAPFRNAAHAAGVSKRLRPVSRLQ